MGATRIPSPLHRQAGEGATLPSRHCSLWSSSCCSVLLHVVGLVVVLSLVMVLCLMLLRLYLGSGMVVGIVSVSVGMVICRLILCLLESAWWDSGRHGGRWCRNGPNDVMKC